MERKSRWKLSKEFAASERSELSVTQYTIPSWNLNENYFKLVLELCLCVLVKGVIIRKDGVIPKKLFRSTDSSFFPPSSKDIPLT